MKMAKPKMTASELMAQGQAWEAANPEGWACMQRIALSLADKAGGPIRIRSVLERLRDEGHTFPNSLSAYATRRLALTLPGVEFTRGRSKLDEVPMGVAS